MLTIVFIILMFIVFGKILKFAVKAAWSVSKIVCSVVLLPIALIGMVVKGIVGIALPILLVIAVISFIFLRD